MRRVSVSIGYLPDNPLAYIDSCHKRFTLNKCIPPIVANISTTNVVIVKRYASFVDGLFQQLKLQDIMITLIKVNAKRESEKRLCRFGPLAFGCVFIREDKNQKIGSVDFPFFHGSI
jgi:hypothetical protein